MGSNLMQALINCEIGLQYPLELTANKTMIKYVKQSRQIHILQEFTFDWKSIDWDLYYRSMTFGMKKYNLRFANMK